MRKVLRIFLVIVILISGIFTIYSYMQEQEDNNVYEGVDIYINANEVITFPGQTDSALDRIAQYQQDYDWEGLLAVNKDIVGWLYIPDNDIINFPIVQGTNNSYYLNHDYTKKWNANGCAFVDCDYNKFCLNKVIYGHNMSRSTTHPIFTTVTLWKDKEYFDSHRTLYYTDVNGMTKKYLIAAVAHFNVTVRDEYSYLDTIFETEEELHSWVNYIKDHSSYFDLGDNTVDYCADEVIVLSTCDSRYGYDRVAGRTTGRTILFCVNLTNNELAGDD